MSLKSVAEQTLAILSSGYFLSPTGERVSLQPALAQAIEGTRLYTPEETSALLDRVSAQPNATLTIDVTDETTQVAAQRLVLDEGVADLVLLNFASARKPGGGFINGAKAQEEDLARCSGLYPCLLTQPGYYEANRAQESAIYTDHLIHSPAVPWFRTHGRDQPERVFLASVITAPAPNAGVALERDPRCGPKVDTALRRRAGMVLAVAADQGHRNLLLGAWGCGVFRNNPVQVADAFGHWLDSERFRGAFERVVFAIYDTTSSRSTLRAFKQRFSHPD